MNHGHIRTECTIRFCDLVDPSSLSGSWNPFAPYSGEIVVGFYQWLVARSVRMSNPARGRLYWPGAYDQVTGARYQDREGGSLIKLSPRTWIETVTTRLRHVLLTQRDRRSMTARFLVANGVGLGMTKVVPVRHHTVLSEPVRDYDDLMTGLGDFTSCTLAKSYNPSHPGAVEIHDVSVHWNTRGWHLAVKYGFPWPDDGSNWFLDENDCPELAPRRAEGFGEFLLRAHALLTAITVPPSDVVWNVYTIRAPHERGVSPTPHYGYVLAPSCDSALEYWRQEVDASSKPIEAQCLPGRNIKLPTGAPDRRAALRITGAMRDEYEDEARGREAEIWRVLLSLTVPPGARESHRTRGW